MTQGATASSIMDISSWDIGIILVIIVIVFGTYYIPSLTRSLSQDSQNKNT